MSTFLENVPVWVVPLFALLVILGLRATRTRRVPIAMIAALPLLGFLTLRNVISLSPDAWIWLTAAAAYGIGVLGGKAVQQGWILERGEKHVEVKGEWLTMTAMMVLFIAGFAYGALSAITPEFASSTTFAVIFTAVICLPAGQFLGRAITTLRSPVTTGA